MFQALKGNLKALSPLTCIWALFIVLSASFMRQLFNLSLSIVSRDAISILIWLSFFCLIGGVALFVVKSKAFKIKNGFFVLIPVLLAVLLALSMDLPEERVHVLKYGLLGFLLAQDCSGASLKNPFGWVCLFGLCVGLTDELFQWILPYRVGDLRDVCFDAVSTFLGGWIFFAPDYNRRPLP